MSAEEQPDRYVLMALKFANLNSEKFKPKEGYSITGRIPCGEKWDQVVYQRVEVVAEIAAGIASQTPPKPPDRRPVGGRKGFDPSTESRSAKKARFFAKFRGGT